MSLGARRDFGASEPAQRILKPTTSYPTFNVKDLVLVEDVGMDATYTPILIGTPRKGATAYKLVAQKEVTCDGDKQYMRRIWATTQKAQEQHNLSLKYLSDDHSYPIFIRKYTILKSAYAALVEGTPLSAVIGLTLTTGGTGYTTEPTVALTGGGGTGATAIAQIRDGAVVALLITAEGTGYTTSPTVGFSGGGGSGAAATAAIQLQTAVLVEQEAVPEQGEMGNLFYEVTRVWRTLPGPVITSYLVDGETQTQVQVDTQEILNPGAPLAQNTSPPGSVEYHPINDVYGKKVTSTLLLSLGSLVRSEAGQSAVRTPHLVFGYTSDSYEGNDGSVLVGLSFTELPDRTRILPSVTIFTYASALAADAVNAYFSPNTVDRWFNGWFLKWDKRGILCNDLGTIHFNTANTNPKWGYVTEDRVFNASSPTASAYAATAGALVRNSVVRDWKYNLKRRETELVTVTALV